MLNILSMTQDLVNYIIRALPRRTIQIFQVLKCSELFSFTLTENLLFFKFKLVFFITVFLFSPM